MHRLSACELRERFVSGEWSAEAIVEHFLERIERLDGQIGAFLRIYRDRVCKGAKALDEKRARGEPLGPLAGVPIAIKDNIHVKGELSTCASQFLRNYIAPFDSTAVKLIEQADGLILGKTNMDEFAMGSTTENSALGVTSNPWKLTCVPGGSSGGSAAAVTAGFCPIALGSDTGGSIRQPAAFCGLMGLKPTYGRVSRYGLVAFGSSLDQIGPFARSAEDIARVMEVIGKPCERDSTSIKESDPPYSLEEGIAGMRIGVPWSFLETLKPEPKALFEQGIERFRSLGAEIVDVDLHLLEHSIATYYIIATAEASTNLARFDGIRFGIRSERAKTLSEVYDFSKNEGFGHEVKRRILLGTFVLSSGYKDAYYRKAQQVRTLLIQHYKKAFERCAVIAMPTAPSVAFKKGSFQDPLTMYLEDTYTISANLAGLPAMSVPCGWNAEGLPFGMQVIGPQQQDALVVRVCRHFHPDMTREVEEKP